MLLSFFLSLLFINYGCSVELVINKCCPKNQHLFKTECVDDDGEWLTKDEDFFPRGIMFNRADHQQIDETQVLSRYRYNTHHYPTCPDVHALLYLKGLKSSFAFLSFPNSTFQIIVPRDISMKPVGELQQMIKNFYPKYDKLFPLDEHTCIDVLKPGKAYIVLVCPCQHHTCIKKCCHENHYYKVEKVGDSVKSTCKRLPKEMDSDHIWYNTTHKGVWKPPIKEGVLHDYFYIPNAQPTCNNKTTILNVVKRPEEETRCDSKYNGQQHKFYILKNGSVKIKKYDKAIDNTQYCGEVTIDDNNNTFHQNLLTCSEYIEFKVTWRAALYGSLLIVGGIALCLTVIISLILPQLKRRVHNKVAICHNASLMVAYFATAWSMFSHRLYPAWCVILSLLIQYSFLASFFWLNVMCLDICLVFSKTRLIDSSAEGDRKKMIYYSAYAWGAAGIFSIFTLIMEYAPGVPDLYYPGMECNCAFDNDTYAVLIYLYCPIGFVLILNLILFILTASRILSVQRQTAILHKKDSNKSGSHRDRQRLIMYSKLFLLMGLPWVMEIISYVVGGSAYYWLLTDLINILRAVFIFVIFICKKKVLRSLQHKFLGRPAGVVSGSSRSEALSYSTNRKSEERRKISREEVEMKTRQECLSQDVGDFTIE